MSSVRRVRREARIVQAGDYEPGFVDAGVLAGATYPETTYTDQTTGEQVVDARGGMPVAAVGMALEYGHGQSHPRPFMRSAFASHRKEWTEIFVRHLRAGYSAHDALSIVGMTMQQDVQESIQSWPADNSAEWAAVKGFNKGLIMTNHLVDSISFAVTMGNPEGTNEVPAP